METATLYATDVGVPTGKHRVFPVAVKRRPDVASAALTAKLATWRLRPQQQVATTPTFGAFWGAVAASS